MNSRVAINHRHKVGLFLTVLSAGLCLLMGTSFRETCGVVLIGLAFSWSLGSAIVDYVRALQQSAYSFSSTRCWAR
jgi:hypothetical protein